MLAVELESALPNPIDIGMRRAKPADIHRPDIERRLATDDPFGQHFSSTAARCNTERIEASAYIKAVDSGCRAKNKISVRSKAFRSIEQFLDAGVFQCGHTRHRQFHDWLEVLPIRLQ